MTTSEIVNLIIAIISIIPTLVSVVCLIINIVKTKNWNLVMDITDAAMREVEEYSRTHPDMTSDDKLNMALKESALLITLNSPLTGLMKWTINKNKRTSY